MLPLLPICTLLLASTAVVLVRLRWHAEMSDDLDYRQFTAAIAAVVAATTLGVNAFGDEIFDPAVAQIGIGENASDLLKSIFLVVACTFFAGQSVTTLNEALPGDRTFDSRRSALIICGAIAVVLAILSRASDASNVPVHDAAQLSDPSSIAYLIIFWSVILVTALLVTAAAAVSVRDNGLHGQLAAMGMAGLASAVVAAFVASRLILDHEQMSAWLTAYGQWWTVPGLIGITIAGLLGIPGRRSVRRA